MNSKQGSYFFDRDVGKVANILFLTDFNRFVTATKGNRPFQKFRGEVLPEKPLS